MSTEHGNALSKLALTMGVALSVCAISPGIHAAGAAPGAGIAPVATAAKFMGKALAGAQSPTAAQAAAMLDSAQDMALPQLDVAPAETGQMLDPLGSGIAAPAQIAPGTPGQGGAVAATAGGAQAAAVESLGSGDGVGTMDFGRTSQNTVYHYTDRLVDPKLRNDYPYRAVGWFVFVASNNATYRCTAQLIGRSILATAGHCVHDGGNKASGWIKSGVFYPAYASKASGYGSAAANYVATTAGWYNTGALDAGYDVALVVLNKKAGTTQEIGVATGTLGFCYNNCLQSYWLNSQLGYPYNYNDGAYLNQSEHLEVSDTRDYMYGTGMAGGSSGGAHVANLGTLNVSAGSAGYWPYRNVLFAVTSWGYTDATLKLGGGSSLSGPGNGNSFKTMFNNACTRSRTLHGTASCTLLP